MQPRLFILFAFLTVTGAAVAFVAPTGGKTVLERGMDAATIRQAYGEPDEIVALPADGVKAEKWIYRRKAGETVHQTQNTQMKSLAMTGINGDGRPVVSEVFVPEYRIKYIASYQVTALMMVDGRLHLARQWYEREEKFTN